MRRILVILAAVAVVVTGCAAPPRAAPPPTALPPAEGGPIDLVGLWRVAGAAGEGPDTWLRLDAGELQLWRDCGMVHGSWTAGREVLAASTYGASGDCATGGMPPSVPWLEAAVTYERAGDTWELRDAGGSVVASLFIDGAPEPIATAAESYTEPPVVDDRVREHFAAVAELPTGMEPVDPEALEGRWVPPGVAWTDVHIELAADGTWTGSDGCNGAGGRWVVGAGGELLATSGASTLMACDGAPVPAMLSAARLGGFDGGQLVLLDAAGTELIRLIRG